jgi:protein phosphatase
VGLVRTENQDYGTLTTATEERGTRPGGRLLVVADGMGGHRGGATASRLAGETVKSQYLTGDADNVPDVLRRALLRANARVFSEAQANPDLRGMGTTTSVLAVRGGEAWFAHVGDSRIYLVRGGEIKQLTEDHSLVASMVREGLITTTEAETHPRRNVLQRSIGVGEDVDVDVSGPFPVQVGDTFILCSDGLHGLVKEGELREVAQLPIENAADEFLKRAMSRGAPDNVTVIVARIETGTEADEAAGDNELFEETIRDTAPMPAPVIGESLAPSPEAGPEAPAPVREAQASPVVTDKTLESPVVSDAPTTVPPVLPAVATASPARTAPKVRRIRGASVVKWALLFVIALGAAGAWLFWSQQKGFDRPTSTQSSR